MNIKKYLPYILLAIVLFIAAGLLFLTAQGDPKKTQTARWAALWGAAGVGVMILAFSIINIVENILSN